MPFKTFNNWLFDNNIKSPIPKLKINDKTDEVITPDIMKYNSPITHTYVINMFLNHPKLSRYFNTYLNDINLRYIEKEDLFKFIKKCVIDFRVNRNSIPYFKRDNSKHLLFDKIRKKVSVLKNHDINLLCELIDRDENKDQIYSSLDIKKPKKEKVKITAQREVKDHINLEEFLSKNFEWISL